MSRPYRILFASPQTLFDVSNGASMQCYTMMQTLAAMGLRVASLGGGIFDNPSGKNRIPNFEEQLEKNKKKEVLVNVDSSASPENPIVHHFFTGFSHSAWDQMTYQEMNRFLNVYTKLLRKFKPDLVMGYGCDPLCRAMWAEAKFFGIPTVYVVCNGNHRHFRFPMHDLVICDSHATADYYKRQEGLTVHPVANFINPKLVVALKRNPQAVTFINSDFAKGVAIVARLILMANRERPDIPFLIVETRRKLKDALKALKVPGGKPGSAFQQQSFRNIVIRPAQFDVKEIYRHTGVLLAPSLWYESWGRVATEAVMNGIPVLASKSGGLPEAVGTGGITLDTPKECSGKPADWLTLPSEESCRPWADALYRLYDERTSALWEARCKETAEHFSLAACGKRLLTLFAPLLERRAGDNDFTRMGSVRYDNDPLDWEEAGLLPRIVMPGQ